MKLRLIDYLDVWGNARDGYEVNNLREHSIIDFSGDDWPDDSAILAALKRIGYIKKTVRRNSVRFDEGCVDMVGITDRNGRPICRLEKILTGPTLFIERVSDS